MWVPSSFTSWCITSSMLSSGRSSATVDCAEPPDRFRRWELVCRSALTHTCDHQQFRLPAPSCDLIKHQRQVRLTISIASPSEKCQQQTIETNVHSAQIALSSLQLSWSSPHYVNYHSYTKVLFLVFSGRLVPVVGWLELNGAFNTI